MAADPAQVTDRHDYGHLDDVMDAKPVRDGWAITFWAAGRAGSFGVAVRVSGIYAETTESILAVTSTAWRKFNRWSSGPSLVGQSLPILPGTTVATRFEAEFATLGALCLIVHDDRSLRERLGDPMRVPHLAHDLAAGMTKLNVASTGIGRDSTDIHVAMQQAGFVHRYRRPLTAKGLPSVGEVVDKVEGKLRSNPYRTGRQVDNGHVERIVRREYLDIEPWPFAAVVDD